MTWYYWLALASLAICLGSLMFHTIRLIKLGKPKDYSNPTGKPSSAIPYSFTGAMSPTKKESAYLHMPTYTAGILYHLGTFLSIFIFLIMLIQLPIKGMATWIIFGFLIITGASGLGIFIKRLVKQQMRALSNPDDYISNLMVTIFQFITAVAIVDTRIIPLYFIVTSLLLLYIPLSKLKHTIYFFAARYHLGYFFGWRNVWPPKQTP
jgi:nitrate reductase gamma subunit